MEIKRGGVFYANLKNGKRIKGMQGGHRPVIVVSNDAANKHSPVITVVPVSSKIYKKPMLPTHILLPKDEATMLDTNSIALCEQVTTLSIDDIEYFMGNLNENLLNNVTNGVLVQIGYLFK